MHEQGYRACGFASNQSTGLGLFIETLALGLVGSVCARAA